MEVIKLKLKLKLKQVSIDRFMVSKWLSRAIKDLFFIFVNVMLSSPTHAYFTGLLRSHGGIRVNQWMENALLFSNNFRICWLFLERNSVGRKIPAAHAERSTAFQRYASNIRKTMTETSTLPSPQVAITFLLATSWERILCQNVQRPLNCHELSAELNCPHAH